MMRTGLLLYSLIVFVCSLTDIKNQNETVFNFGLYKAEISSCGKGTSVEILKSKERVFYSCGGDGIFLHVDTAEINGDGVLDFVFEYVFDDYSSIGVIVSHLEGYSMVDVKDVVLEESFCQLSTEDIPNVKTYIVLDVDNDGKIDILTNVLSKNNSIVSLLGCSDTLSNQFILEKIKKSRSRAGFLMNDESVQRFPGAWRNAHGIQPPNGGGITAPADAFAMYHTHWDAPGKTIWVDAMGNRVDNSSDPLALLGPGVSQTTTARERANTAAIVLRVLT